jgi:hypothetical protein
MRATDAAHRTLFAISHVIIAVNVLSLIADSRDHAHVPLFVVDSAHALVALSVAVAAWRAPRSWSERSLELVFGLMTAPFLVGLWLPQAYSASDGGHVDPLLASRFLLLGLAVSAPTWRSGAIALVVFSTHAAILWHVLVENVSTFALDREPWFTLFFAAIAVMLLYTREHRRDLERRLAAVEARAQTLTQVSQVLLALRDKANTPLQTLELAVSLLERQAQLDKAVTPAMRRALQRLTAIQNTLARGTTHSFDLDVPLDLDAALAELMQGRDVKGDRD